MRKRGNPTAHTLRRLRLWEMYARRFCRRHMPPGWFEENWGQWRDGTLDILTEETAGELRSEHPTCNN